MVQSSPSLSRNLDSYERRHQMRGVRSSDGLPFRAVNLLVVFLLAWRECPSGLGVLGKRGGGVWRLSCPHRL